MIIFAFIWMYVIGIILTLSVCNTIEAPRSISILISLTWPISILLGGIIYLWQLHH